MESLGHVRVQEEAALTDAQVLQMDRLSGRKVEVLLRNSSSANDIQSSIFNLKATDSLMQEGCSNEDTVSFDLFNCHNWFKRNDFYCAQSGVFV